MRRASVRWATPASIARSARAPTIARATASASTGLVCATTASQGATARCSTARAAADGTSTASMARALAVLAGPARIATYESAQPTATGGATATMARAIAALATAAVLLVESAPWPTQWDGLMILLGCPGRARRATSSLETCAGHASPLSQPQREFNTFNEQVARARRSRAPTSARDTARATRHLRACASLASPASTVRCRFARKIARTTAIATEASAIAGRAFSAPTALSLRARTIATPTAGAST